MGPAVQAALSPDVHTASFPTDPDGLASPASITDSLHTPTFRRPSTTTPGPWTPPCLLPDTMNTLAGDVRVTPVLTPPLQVIAEADMNTLVGGALAPVHLTPPLKPISKPGPGLRLPSFESLGIAAPHPDRFGHSSSPDDSHSESTRGIGAGDLTGRHTENEEPLITRHTDNAEVQVTKLPCISHSHRAVQSPIKQWITTLTPPAESGEMQWLSLSDLTNTPAGSDRSSHGVTTSFPLDAVAGAESSGTVAPASVDVDEPDNSDDPQSWINGAIRVLLHNLESAQIPTNPVKVLSHALPSPSTKGHIYARVIGAIHDSTPRSPTVWVNVLHAIPGRFNLADLPTSPPSTPGPAIGGDDYFTQKVFDSAVPITDYQDDLSSLPRSPRPVVPPSSIHISVVERYIPPTNVNEFSNMFETSGPSILVDRLTELSPHNGSLVFIYPTKTGAQTFMREYLGPVLDPLLRSVVVVNGLSTDLSRTLGHMAAADRLLEYDVIRRKMAFLCSNLTQRSTSMPQFYGRRARFDLVYAAKKSVPLSRETWAQDWWTKQEKPRVREAVTRYAQEAQRKITNDHLDRPATPAELIQQLLDGVSRKPYQAGQEPQHGIEVSVFVIKRSE